MNKLQTLNGSPRKLQTLQGIRDFLPETMTIRNKIINTLKAVFESYGFANTYLTNTPKITIIYSLKSPALA